MSEPEVCLFPYSSKKPILRECKNSGDGTVWRYAGNREKYAKLCDHCNQNPDLTSNNMLVVTPPNTLDFGIITKNEELGSLVREISRRCPMAHHEDYDAHLGKQYWRRG